MSVPTSRSRMRPTPRCQAACPIGSRHTEPLADVSPMGIVSAMLEVSIRLKDREGACGKASLVATAGYSAASFGFGIALIPSPADYREAAPPARPSHVLADHPNQPQAAAHDVSSIDAIVTAFGKYFRSGRRRDLPGAPQPALRSGWPHRYRPRSEAWALVGPDVCLSR